MAVVSADRHAHSPLPPWTGAFALDVLASAVALFVSALTLVSCNPLKKSFCFFVFFLQTRFCFFYAARFFFCSAVPVTAKPLFP